MWGVEVLNLLGGSVFVHACCSAFWAWETCLCKDQLEIIMPRSLGNFQVLEWEENAQNVLWWECFLVFLSWRVHGDAFLHRFHGRKKFRLVLPGSHGQTHWSIISYPADFGHVRVSLSCFCMFPKISASFPLYFSLPEAKMEVLF